MNKMIKDTLILFAITLAAGLGLGAVYNVTKEARAKQEEKVKLEAYQSVMPDMADYQKISGIDYDRLNTEIKKKITENEAENHLTSMKPYQGEINEVVSARDSSGKEIGMIITVTDNEAYDGSLQMTVGIAADQTVLGISFLSLSETPGLGMKAKEASFINQFQNKKADYFVYSKTGASAQNEIDAISSATITTSAVTHGVNAAVICADLCRGGEDSE